MGFDNSSPNITQVDPTNPAAQGATSAAGNFFENIFSNAGSGLGAAGGNAIASTLGQNPLLDTASQLFGGFQAGQQVVNALQPIQQQQLQQGLGQITSGALGIGNTAAAQQGAGFANQALQGFNAQNAQFLQQGQALDLQALLGQQQNMNQLLGIGAQFAAPQNLETIAQAQGPGFGGFLGQLGGGLLGSVLGPVGAAAGSQLAGSIFGGGGGGGQVISAQPGFQTPSFFPTGNFNPFFTG